MNHIWTIPTFALLLASSSFPSFVAAQPIGHGSQLTDVDGDPLPPHAVARIGTSRLRHAAYVSSLAFSPDGNRISSTTIWFDVGVWDVHSGRSISFHNSRRNDHNLFRAVVSPDGRLFAGRMGKGDLGVQDAVSGKILHRFSGKTQMCEGLVFSRDNQWLVSADENGTTFLWDLQRGKLAQQFNGKKAEQFNPLCNALTPDGTILIQARNEDITFWNAQTGKEIRRVDSKLNRGFPGEWTGEAAVSPDGKLLSVHVANGRVELWDLKTGEYLRKLADQNNMIGPVFSPDCKQVATGTESGAICFWDVETGKLLRTLVQPAEAHPTSFAFSPDGKRLAVGSSDHAIHLWDLPSGKELRPADSRIAGKPSVCFLSDGKTLLTHCEYDRNSMYATIDPRLSLWDLSGKPLRESLLAPKNAHAFGITGDARIVAYGTGPNFGLTFRPVPNGSLRSTIRLCDVTTGKQLVKVNNVPCQILDITFSLNNRYMLVNAFNAGVNPESYGHIDTLQLWKRTTPTSLDKVADIPMKSFLSGYCVSADSRWVVVTNKTGYRFHDCETGQLIRSWPETPGSAVAVSPSGRVLVSRDAEDGRTGKSVHVWEKATGKVISTLDCEPGQLDWCPIVVSPDGMIVAGCLDREDIALWDIFTGKRIALLEGHRGDIRSLSFSPDGQFLVSASEDTTILIWDWKKKLPKAEASIALPAEKLEQLGKDLMAADSRRAYQAIKELIKFPDQAMELVKTKILPVSVFDRSKLKAWIEDLDNDSFAMREKAMNNLIASGDFAAIALGEEMGKKRSEDSKNRIIETLESLPLATPHPSAIAVHRCLELLEMLRTSESQKLIEELARNGIDPLHQREAAQVLARIKPQR